MVALTIEDARGGLLYRTNLLVVEDAVDAAVLAAETCGCAGRAAARTTALAALDRAARLAVVVLASVALEVSRAPWSCYSEDGPRQKNVRR